MCVWRVCLHEWLSALETSVLAVHRAAHGRLYHRRQQRFIRPILWQRYAIVLKKIHPFCLQYGPKCFYPRPILTAFGTKCCQRTLQSTNPLAVLNGSGEWRGEEARGRGIKRGGSGKGGGRRRKWEITLSSLGRQNTWSGSGSKRWFRYACRNCSGGELA